MPSWIGQTLNERFRVEAELGRGGMAAVYRASDLRLGGRPVVVKHPLREIDRVGGLTDDELRRRFSNEVSRLIHLDDVPNVVPLLDQGVHEGTPFYVMRYMAGGSLADALRRGPQTPGEALGWLVPVAEALDQIHERGVLHRDVKPANLLFELPPEGAAPGPGRAHLADFGIVKELQTAWATTGLNTAIGTPGFMAPEQHMPDADPDGRADQYSLGATLYCALAGQPPQWEAITGRQDGGGAPRGGPGGEHPATGRKRLKPLHAPDLAPHVPAAASAAIERAMAREPAARFPTCTAFVEAFAAALGTPGPDAVSGAPPGAPRGASASAPAGGAWARGGRGRALAALLALAAVGGGLYATLRGSGGASGPAGPRAASGPGATGQVPVVAAERPTPSPAAPPAPPGPPASAARPPVVAVVEPTEASVVTEQEVVSIRGTVDVAGGSLVGVRLLDGERLVPLDPSGAFAIEVHLALDAERSVSLVAVDPAGNVSERVTRSIRREASWAAALGDALAAMARDDGEAAVEAWVRGQDLGAPRDGFPEVAAYVRRWRRPPSVEILAPAAGTRMVRALGTTFEIEVRGKISSGRRRDRLFVDDVPVELAADRDLDAAVAFQARVTRQVPGELLLVAELRDGLHVRARAQAALTLAGTTPQPAVLSGSPDGDEARRRAADAAGTGPTDEDMAALAEINRQRTSRGLKALVFEPRLFAAARAHSQEQLDGNYLGHGAPDPERATLGKRVTQAGYVGRMYAEVVASDYPDAATVVAAWMDSVRHREVLLDPELSEAAVSRVNSPRSAGLNRWTGDFGAPVATGPRVSIPPSPAPRSLPRVVGEPSWVQPLVSQAQRDEAKRVGVPLAFEEPTTGMRFVLIPAGKFTMGAPVGEEGREADEGPVHEVMVTSYYLGVTEVTNAQYRKKVPTHRSGEDLDGDRQPAVKVSHADATAFVQWLSEQGTTKGFRLPSEAEWERACRAGTRTRFWFGNDDAQLPLHDWYEEGTGVPTHAVGGRKPNPWGLFDLHGNAAEWCSDWMGPYVAGPVIGPLGPGDGTARVVRGGSFADLPRRRRSAARASRAPGYADTDVGFRVALPASSR